MPRSFPFTLFLAKVLRLRLWSLLVSTIPLLRINNTASARSHATEPTPTQETREIVAGIVSFDLRSRDAVDCSY
jgi:hypothetical protein